MNVQYLFLLTLNATYYSVQTWTRSHSDLPSHHYLRVTHGALITELIYFEPEMAAHPAVVQGHYVVMGVSPEPVVLFHIVIIRLTR